jgi:hypothetical protein
MDDLVRGDLIEPRKHLNNQGEKETLASVFNNLRVFMRGRQIGMD